MNRRKGDHFKRIFIYILIVPLDNIDATPMRLRGVEEDLSDIGIALILIVRATLYRYYSDTNSIELTNC
jgi:hypothetical protein